MVGVSEATSFTLLHVGVLFSHPYLLKRLSFPHCMLLAPLLEISDCQGLDLFSVVLLFSFLSSKCMKIFV